jgi:hypothetical protein
MGGSEGGYSQHGWFISWNIQIYKSMITRYPYDFSETTINIGTFSIDGHYDNIDGHYRAL